MMEWVKFPVVGSGGKEYFYGSKKDGKLYHVVWDKGIHKWLCQIDHSIAAVMDTEVKAKQYLEREVGV